MSDSKSPYSEASRCYVEVDARQSTIDARQYANSKAREREYGAFWKKNYANLNDIVDRFAPNATGQKKGCKLVFQGSRYAVIADMPAGYLRIYDEELESFITLDGTPSRDGELTHFKIPEARGDADVYIVLILDPFLIHRRYGRIPETSDAPVNSYELHRFTFSAFDYFDLIDTDFVNPVDELCGALLDIGDEDYLDAQQCSILIPWLVKRLAQACPHPLDKFYSKLLDFAQRAVELGTGVVVEL